MTARKQLFFHIGMGKTGTTALQNFFHQNRKQLAKKGVDYPNCGLVAGAHHGLSPHQPPFLAGHWKYVEPETWVPKLAKSKHDTILLSSELASSGAPAVVEAFANDVGTRFDVRIVIYFRRQDELIASAYKQQIRAGTLVFPFETVLNRQFDNFSFVDKIEPWAKAFGEENIIVVPYERQQFYEGDIRKDFLKRVLGIDDSRGFVFEKQQRNQSFSFGAAEFKRLVNSVVPESILSNRFNKCLEEYSFSVEGAGRFPSNGPCPSSLGRQVVRRSAEINAEIARKYLGRADGKLFYAPEPEYVPDEPEPEFTSEELAHIMRFLEANEPALVDILAAKIAEARENDRFEAFFATKRLSKAMNTEDNRKGGNAAVAPVSAQEAYVHNLNSDQSDKLRWHSQNEFEVNGCRFTIDLTPGSKRRVSTENNFTIVKTRKFLGAYVDIPLAENANILELGIFQGGSLVFMERLFKPRKIVGVDLSKTPVDALETYKGAHPSVATYYGVSQDDPKALKAIIDTEFGGEIDMVVDDASHLYEQTRASFEITFPYLKRGGYYVIEDWAWSFKPPHQTSASSWYNKPAMVNLIYQLIGDIASNHAIESMFIQENLAIIRKGTSASARPPLEIRNYRNRKVKLI